jgi:hypothetical protein
MLDYWRLPGPAAFIAEVLNEVSSGRNVALLLPERGPLGALDAVRDSLRDRWSVGSVANPSGAAPIQAVYDCILGRTPEDLALTAAQLSEDDRLVGSVVFVEDIGPQEWPVWKTFIEEYEVGCRRLPVDRRMLVVMTARGTQARNPPASEVALAVLRWNDYLSDTDMQIYAVLRLRDRTLHRRKRQIVAACLARMAVWDVEVIDRFCEGDPERVLEPLELLAAWGAEKGWNCLATPSWENGAAHQVDGAEQLHSAYLACHEPRAIGRRLWAAQSSVLLPLIEERRIELLPRVAPYINFPLQTSSGTVTQLEDLEIGQMSWQLHAARAERGLIRIVDRLKTARDSLAHLQPLSREACFHGDLIG